MARDVTEVNDKTAVHLPGIQVRCDASGRIAMEFHRLAPRTRAGCGSCAADAISRPATTDCASLPARASLPSSRRHLEEDDALRAVDVDDAGLLDPA